jgi:hypothetical protein
MDTTDELREDQEQRRMFNQLAGQTVLRIVEQKTTTRIVMSGGYFIEVLNAMVVVGRH